MKNKQKYDPKPVAIITTDKHLQRDPLSRPTSLPLPLKSQWISLDVFPCLSTKHAPADCALHSFIVQWKPTLKLQCVDGTTPYMHESLQLACYQSLMGVGHM